MGPRGVAKSTLARGLAEILPQQQKQHPFVTLPLNTTEEMLVGTLNLEQILTDRSVVFQPGLLAKAHQGVLYVDEVNLLNDSLVDLLLDVAASGVNLVERDGISHSHESRFVLLGTMNPDEGELRPQLLDRFGFAIELESTPSAAERVEIVKRRQQFDNDPAAFVAQYETQQGILRDKIQSARLLLPQVNCSDSLRMLIAQRCLDANVDGVRADLVWLRGALAHAALNGRQEVEQEDVLAVEELVLCHRRQADSNKMPPAPPPFQRPMATPNNQQSNDTDSSGSGRNEHDETGAGDWGGMQPQQQQLCAEDKLNVGRLMMSLNGGCRSGSQSPSETRRKGRQQRMYQGINWSETLRQSAGHWPLPKLIPRLITTQRPRLHMVMLDASASMVGGHWFARAKAIVRSIAARAYHERHYFMLLGFGNGQVLTHLNKRRAPKELASLLDGLEAGGGTPLHTVLVKAAKEAQRYMRQEPATDQAYYLITDGRSKLSVKGMQLPGSTWVIDVESSAVKRGRGPQIAQELQAQYIAASELLV